MVKRSTVYVKEYPWQKSPEVLKGVAGWVIGAAVVGFLAGVIAVGNVEEKVEKGLKPTPCPASSAPKDPR